MTNLQDPSDWYIYLSFTIKNNPSCRYKHLDLPPPPHTETVSHHQDCEPFLRWGIRTTKPTRLWRLHPGWGGRPKVYILGKLWYFTNLDFPEIRWFPVLNYRLRWGRLRSLKNCLDIHNTWILWDTLEAQNKLNHHYHLQLATWQPPQAWKVLGPGHRQTSQRIKGSHEYKNNQKHLAIDYKSLPWMFF